MAIEVTGVIPDEVTTILKVPLERILRFENCTWPPVVVPVKVPVKVPVGVRCIVTVYGP